MADLLESTLAQSIGWALVNFVWQGAIIGVATAVALRTLDRARANVRYLVACAGLVLMILLPVWSVLAYQSPAPLESAALAAPLELMRSTSIARLLPLAVAAWMAGVGLLSIRLLAACVRVERLKRATRAVDASVSYRARLLAQRLGVGPAIRVCESALVRVPTVVGCLRPVVLLPASVVTGLPAAHLDAVLAHELAHVRRHDYLVNLLQSIVETLLFYHPAVWWCSRRIRIEREHCCDDLVVDVCGDRLIYATALSQLEEMRGLKPMLSLNASGGRLIDRVRRLLTQTPDTERRSTIWAVGGVLTVVVIAVALAPVLLMADALRLPATPGQTASPLVPPQSPELPAVPAPQAPPPDIDRVSNDPEVAAETLQFGDDPRQAIEEALEKLARETAGLLVFPQDPPPAPPLPPRSPSAPGAPAPAPAAPVAPPAPAAWPASPLPSLPPLPPQPQSLPIAPAPPTAPAPPAPPQSLPASPGAAVPPTPPAPPSEIVQIDPDIIAREMRRASEQLTAGFEDLRRATKETNEKQEALQQAQAEIAKMRVETLTANTKIEAIRQALVELSARSAALRNGQLDEAAIRKQLESIRQAIEDLNAR